MSVGTAERLRAVIAKQLGVPEAKVTPSLKMGDHPLWDSMGHMNLLSAVEKEFGVRFPGHALARVTSVEAIAKELEKLVAR